MQKTALKKAAGIITCCLLFATSYAQPKENGFTDHGVAVPISNHRGVVATVDGQGRNVVLAWLFDHRGGYALLMIDAATGKSEQFPMPFAPGDAPYASLLSSKNRYYTFFNKHFVEFDPVKRAFTFFSKASPQMAMGFTEDDKGVIWAVTYPNSGVVSFDPATKSFKDYGYLYKQNWRQYPRYIAADDAGWIYFAIGNTASQIVAYEPSSGTTIPLLAEEERQRGPASVVRHRNGKVYGAALNSNVTGWYELYRGKRTAAAKPAQTELQPIITGSQVLFHADFPDGSKLQSLDLVERKMVVTGPGTTPSHTLPIEYSSEGALVMGVGTAPNGTIAGGAAFPMRFFNYDPKSGRMEDKPAFGQFNAMASRNGLFYFASYPQGTLLQWDPTRPWQKGSTPALGNPAILGNSVLMTHRPHCILAAPDNKTVILSGTPEYGYTGGGLLFCDLPTKKIEVLKDSGLIIDQSTMVMEALPKHKMLGGTTTMPGTGGEKKAKEAELYIMDLATRKIEWRAALIPGVQDYLDLYTAADGLIYGVADRRKLFVFDAKKKKIVFTDELEPKFGLTTYAQGPRIFVEGDKGEVYMLFNKGIAQLFPKDNSIKILAESPVPIETGGAYLDGRIYFVSGSHIFSYQVKK